MAYAHSIITKIRPNTSVPFKNPNQPLNYPSWPGFIQCVSNIVSEDSLTETITNRWENRTYFENPVLTEAQLAVKAQGEQWVVDNNISISIQVIDV